MKLELQADDRDPCGEADREQFEEALRKPDREQRVREFPLAADASGAEGASVGADFFERSRECLDVGVGEMA